MISMKKILFAVALCHLAKADDFVKLPSLDTLSIHKDVPSVAEDTVEIAGEKQNSTLFGIVLKDHHIKVYKITIATESEGDVKITTPDGVFLTKKFDLVSDDSSASLETPTGLKARLLSIKQGDRISNFFHTADGRLGFVDYDVISATDADEAAKVAATFLENAQDSISDYFDKVFGNGEADVQIEEPDKSESSDDSLESEEADFEALTAKQAKRLRKQN